MWRLFKRFDPTKLQVELCERCGEVCGQACRAEKLYNAQRDRALFAVGYKVV